MNNKERLAFHQGHSLHAHSILGAHLTSKGGKQGVQFTVYAPHAQQVEVVGDFNQWLGSQHSMTRDGDFFNLFVPGIKEYDRYKYHILTSSNQWIDKADPFGFYAELRPLTASKVADLSHFPWMDGPWLNKRTKNLDAPMSIYELHLGSWRQKWGGEFFSYEELVKELLPYVIEQGFTHIEIMPVLENPLDLSWGYLCTGYFSVTSRYGNPKQLMHFVDACHQAGIGVIMDFVPVHFIKDPHGLHLFDGEPLFEYGDEYRRYSQWGSVNFNLYKEEVRSFLMSSANFWIEQFHFDGIRFDAVSNLIFWDGNSTQGINFGAIDFVKRMNHLLAEAHPNVMLIAEDSSAYQGVTKPTFDGGLGFDYKWDLGWMNDTLKYYGKDPIYRKHHHHNLTFSMHYFYSDRFLLPLSHDEVVHGKGTIINKMWGDYEQKFAQVRNLYAYMYMHPGKKLNFMGNELGAFDEWNEAKGLEWSVLQYPKHQGVQRLIRDLNLIYRAKKALYVGEHDPAKFMWVMHSNEDQSIYAFTRTVDNSKLIAVFNMTPIDYSSYELGAPWAGEYHEILNTDKDVYGGQNRFNYDVCYSYGAPLHNQPQRIGFRLAPFAAILFEVVEGGTK